MRSLMTTFLMLVVAFLAVNSVGGTARSSMVTASSEADTDSLAPSRKLLCVWSLLGCNPPSSSQRPAPLPPAAPKTPPKATPKPSPAHLPCQTSSPACTTKVKAYIESIAACPKKIPGSKFCCNINGIYKPYNGAHSGGKFICPHYKCGKC